MRLVVIVRIVSIGKFLGVLSIYKLLVACSKYRFGILIPEITCMAFFLSWLARKFWFSNFKHKCSANVNLLVAWYLIREVSRLVIHAQKYIEISLCTFLSLIVPLPYLVPYNQFYSKWVIKVYKLSGGILPLIDSRFGLT